MKLKLYLFSTLFCAVAYIHAVTNMGTTPLLYGSSNASDVLMAQQDERKINDPNTKLGIRRIILSEVVKQMATFQPLLDKTLAESGAYVVYDGKPILQNWRNTNLQILTTFYKTTSVPVLTDADINKNNAATQASGKVTTAAVNNVSDPPRKFVLLGFVDYIHEQESRTPIQGTDKTALLYNLDIRCEYKMINPVNNRVVAVFTGAGHGGIARILGAGSPPVNFDAKLVVNDMFVSLAENVRHILLVRRAEYIKKRNNAKKVNLSIQVPGK
ncbi:MAG: hypothetical protein K0R14_901 [Burkholderiales bacterium]|jgi:hypothetical protein|nr:hypothetical protein [Burkholderiales bacterium]